MARLRQDLGEQVPDDYLAFLAARDGAEGAVGVVALAAQVGRGVDLYPELDRLGEFVVIGSDGGGEAFALAPNGSVVVVPWVGEAEHAILQGTFPDFLSRLADGGLFEPES